MMPTEEKDSTTTTQPEAAAPAADSPATPAASVEQDAEKAVPPKNLMNEKWKDASAKVQAFIGAMKAEGVACSVQFSADGVAYSHMTAIPGIAQIGALEFAKAVTLDTVKNTMAVDQLALQVAANPELAAKLKAAMGLEIEKQTL